MATKKVEVAMDGAKATVEVKEPPKKKCDIAQVLPPGVLPLVKAAPANETIRALMLAHLKVPVPKEADTYEKVKEWIEFNVEKPLHAWARAHPADPIPRAPRNRVQIQVRASDVERGTCRYTQNVSGVGNVPLDRDEIVVAASESDNPNEFFSRIEVLIDEEGTRDYVEMAVVEGSEETSDHEYDDSDGITSEITDAGKRAVKEALLAADPELYRSIFGG